jgi:nucleotide-binding universal stress UspA family protein
VNTTPFSSPSTIVVAVAFDPQTEPLAQWAAALARALGKKLRLVHAVETWAEIGSSLAGVERSPLREVVPAVTETAREAATDRLAALASSLGTGISIDVVAATGSPVAILAQEAAAVDTCLLIVGAHFQMSTLVPRGLSTTLSLLATASVPVLAADARGHLPKPGAAVRLLVADDLGEQTESAVAFAGDMACAWHRAWVHHVHVSALSDADLESALRNAAIAARTVMTPDQAQVVCQAVHREQLRSLETRFADRRDALAASGGSYTSEVVPGGVKAELARLATDIAPDLLVFGRRAPDQPAATVFGRMPYRAMLAMQRPVLVVPSF